MMTHQHFRETTSKESVWMLGKHKVHVEGVERPGLFKVEIM